MINKYYLDDDTYLNLSGDLAHKFMEGMLKSEIKNYITPNPKDGEQYYTDEGEKIWQKCLADIEAILKSNDIYSNDFEEAGKISIDFNNDKYTVLAGGNKGKD